MVGYSPFGHGRFPSDRSAGGRALAAVAARHGATPRQVALAFLVATAKGADTGAYTIGRIAGTVDEATRAALMGAERGLEVHVLDRVTTSVLAAVVR